MPDKEDDPRQVLSVLNSLGFVGITAPQLKAFMKDLKLLRKIKERERQQWREETKRKIFFKQQKALAKLLTDEPDSPRNTDSVPNVSSDDSVIKIRIRCISESESEKNNSENEPPKQTIQRRQSPSPKRRVVRKEKGGAGVKCQKNKTSQGVGQQKCMKEADNQKSRKSESEIINSLSEHAASALELSEKVTGRSRSKSIADSVGSRASRSILSRSSSRSRPKSFIRPWKLRPETPQYTKSDPVMLYQKYQKEWKKNPLPGEKLHNHIRWAVREKMLGADPMPKPILKKSCSIVNVKKL